MGTYAYLEGGSSLAKLPAHRPSPKILKRRLDVAAIIASNATLKAAAKITAADVIQAIKVPDNFILIPSMTAIKVVTQPSAAQTLDVGIAGSNELINNGDVNVAAGTILVPAVANGWGPDNVVNADFEAADTIDVTFDSDGTDGVFDLYIGGFELD
jgi:hypothetical protein